MFSAFPDSPARVVDDLISFGVKPITDPDIRSQTPPASVADSHSACVICQRFYFNENLAHRDRVVGTCPCRKDLRFHIPLLAKSRTLTVSSPGPLLARICHEFECQHTVPLRVVACKSHESHPIQECSYGLPSF